MSLDDLEKPDLAKFPLKSKLSSPLSLKLSLSRSLLRSKAHEHLAPPEGNWLTLAALNISGTAQPSFLSLPYAMAGLGWTGGMVVLIVSGVAALFGTLLLAWLHHEDGIRHTRYRDMSRHILGRDKIYSGAVVYVFQYAVNFGVGCANIILSAQLLGHIWGLFCGGEDVCSRMNNTRWTLVIGCLGLAISQIPNLAALEVVVLFGTVFTFVYVLVGVVLSFQQGLPSSEVSYDLVGSTAGQAFNALNAIGMIAFTFGNTIAPEMQATLRVTPPDTTSVRPMILGTSASFGVILPLYTLVSVVGYLKFGNAAPGFLLQQFNYPAGLVAMAEAMCIFQLLSSWHIYVYSLYEAVETKVLQRAPMKGWVRSTKQIEDGTTWEAPSALLRLAVRFPFVIVFTFIGAAIPFFTSIMSLIGAVGLAPLTFVIPAALYLEARGPELARWQWWGLVIFAVTFALLGLGAAVGALRTIIVTASTFQFFS